jgi:hypothetical protein
MAPIIALGVTQWLDTPGVSSHSVTPSDGGAQPQKQRVGEGWGIAPEGLRRDCGVTGATGGTTPPQ